MAVLAVLSSVGETADFSIYCAGRVRNNAEVRIHDGGQIKRRHRKYGWVIVGGREISDAGQPRATQGLIESN